MRSDGSLALCAATLALAGALLLGCDRIKLPDAEPDGVPRGAYLETCRMPQVLDDGERLTAECPDADGDFFATTLRLPCWGEIVNEGGWLSCADDPGPTLPEGPYRTQCRDERLEGDSLLVAECRDRRNRWIQTSLSVPCGDSIRVEDGLLVCGRIADAPAVAISIPDGSFLESCANQRLIEESLLIAECADGSGGVIESRLRLPCSGDVANEAGQLVCKPRQ